MKANEPLVEHGFYYIDPDGPEGQLQKFVVHCNMTAGGK